MRACYGITVEPTTNSVYVTVAEKALNTLSLVAIPGSFLVDIIPALKYVPQWFPGAEFKRKAARWRKELNEFINLPFNHVKELMVRFTSFVSIAANHSRFTDGESLQRAGTAVPCLLTKLLDALPDEGDPLRTEEENRAKHVPANAYAGKSDPLRL